MNTLTSQTLWKSFAAIGFALLPSLETAAQAPACQVKNVAGQEIVGTLVSWTTHGLSLETSAGRVDLKSKDLLRVTWDRDSLEKQADSTYVELIDGTRLRHQSFEVQGDQAIITSALAQDPLKIQTDEIVYVQLQPQAPEQDELDQDLAGDLLIVRKQGAQESETLTGVLGNISSTQVEFNWDGETIPVKKTKVAALKYFRREKTPTKEPVSFLTMGDGSQLPAVEIHLQGVTVEVLTSGGMRFSLNLDSIELADFSRGKLVYLSDLKPVEQSWMPRIALPKSATLIYRHGLPRRDQSYSGSAITLSWPQSKEVVHQGEVRRYAKGLAIRSRTRLRYRIPQGMNRFMAIAGIDPETSQQGNMILEVFADRQPIWQGEISGESPPQEINVAVGEARAIILVVDYGKNLDYGDRLHLAEARLSR